MPCLVPFNDEEVELSFFAFRPVGLFAEEVVEALKWFSFYNESQLGCAFSCVMKSIHGSMIVWVGAWLKSSQEKKRLLSSTLVSTLSNISNLAILLDHGFLGAYAGQNKDGRPSSTAKFSIGDAVSVYNILPKKDNDELLSYACMAILRSFLPRMEGVASGLCFNRKDKAMVTCLHVWRSLFDCYSWLLTSDPETKTLPYLSEVSEDVEYDVFRVVYVSGDEVGNARFMMLRNAEEEEEISSGAIQNRIFQTCGFFQRQSRGTDEKAFQYGNKNAECE
ncbi:hypothetical protein QJS04_geneDACA022147 [Acorus gramineus]|uniref:DUF7392 domain-containing protein n=1 Tax=Acorus gramineus TaxID=55184 RepID=A0AAV9BLQ2_ACOGR|nr:hypothetical protein QJS04_geneDACA022147 [Acorus gramineus]